MFGVGQRQNTGEMRKRSSLQVAGEINVRTMERCVDLQIVFLFHYNNIEAVLAIYSM